ncbi:MAG: amino acid adenylation domain-containing protein [Rhizonema sp. PD38]|nr:amino acid adenylation domain-containing protein [Rhizonema sp. PD38]
MSELSQQIAELSPEKRQLFLQRLNQKKNNVFSKTQIKSQSRDSNYFPLSFAQERLWFLDQLQPGQSLYNEPYAFHLYGLLNQTALAQSLNEIVQRHEILRTHFTTVDGQPLQVIATTLALALPIVDLQLLPKDQQEAEVRSLVTNEQARPFDLANDPLVRTTLLQLDEAQYVLLFTMHHIVCDIWSFGVIIREIVALYEAFSIGKPSPLPELPIQYADFAVWQRQWLQGEVQEAQLSYWKQQLSSTPTILELPTDRPRPAVQTNRGATQSLILSKPLTEALQKLSQQEKVTLFMTLLAAFQTLLYRYTGQDDIVVGITISGRNRDEIEGLIGFFVNTLVMRTDLSGTSSFREILNRVREVALGAYANQDLPFEQLVEKLQPERNLSHTPLFQVMFQLQNTPTTTLALPGLTLSPLEFDKETAKFDLTLCMVEKEQQLLGILVYNTDLFDAATIHRMLGHFQTLLSSIVANPDQQISKLSIISEEERHQLLIEWNKTQVDYPQNQCIHELFEAQVKRSPDAIAVVFEDQQLTYQELNQRANQLAHHLRSLGVRPEVLVGICVERSLDMVIGLLGILKAGGAYVPLDPSYPKERLAFMLENAQPIVLLTQLYLLKIPTHKAKVVCLDSDWEAIAHQKIENPVCNITFENLAYVIYTSGSTGRPKGAMNTHQGICNRLLWMQDAYQLTVTDRVLQKTPFSFDVSVWEFFWPLLTGAVLVVARPEGHKDTNYLVNLIAQQQISTLHFVPSMLNVFLEAENLETCKSLKRVMASGEVLPRQLQKRFSQRLEADLHNLYGPTEAAVDVTYWAGVHQNNIEKNSTHNKTIPIGRPIANIQIYLLDQHLNLVPVGVTGEVYIGGVGVGRGYLNSPELTAEKFIPNAFTKQSATRLYKTGDLARYLPNGEIEYINRIDHQVKIRGFRIELGEIESFISQHPAVREAVVIVRSDLADSQRLVAYVVSHSEQTLAISELCRFLESKLPNYMVPGTFMMLEALPLTPNGKVDRQVLPVPNLVSPELEAVYQQPQTEVEQAITNIWQEVLHVDKLGINDNFFEIGGHSLLMVKIHSRLREIFKADVSILEMFRYPTISSLAQYLSALQKQTTSSFYTTDVQTGNIEAGKAQQKKRLQKIQSIKNSKEVNDL